MSLLSDIIEYYGEDEELLTADGFDSAVIGIELESNRLIYSQRKCIEILMETMSRDEAIEYFDFNVSGAYFGDRTPIWCCDLL